MTHRSIRVRLTAFYTGVVLLATLVLAAGSWWILVRGITREADQDLRSRIDGVREFIEHAQDELHGESLLDEFTEYAELTGAEALVDVRDAAGASLVRPSLSGWDDLAARAPATARGEIRSGEARFHGAPFRIAAADLDVRGRAYRVIVALSMNEAYGTLARVRLLFVLLLPGFALLAAGGGYWLTGRALRPVGRMARAARAITVRSLDQRLELPAADDELRDLATTFNEMLARLQQSVAEIVRFTADASHELRSPVSRMRTTAELALRRERTAPEYRQALAEVLLETEHVSRLVQELLALAREDAGIEDRRTAPFDLSAVAADAVRSMRDIAALRQIAIDLEAPHGTIELRGDPSVLRRLVVILLENAVSYTPQGGKVHVRVSERSGQSVVLEVSDTGRGIDACDLPHVFDRFYRGAAARQLAPDGSGLGLAIAKTIVERHRGSLHVENAASPATGCIVRVKLPRPGRESAPPDPVDDALSSTPRRAAGSR